MLSVTRPPPLARPCAGAPNPYRSVPYLTLTWYHGRRYGTRSDASGVPPRYQGLSLPLPFRSAGWAPIARRGLGVCAFFRAFAAPRACPPPIYGGERMAGKEDFLAAVASWEGASAPSTVVGARDCSAALQKWGQLR